MEESKQKLANLIQCYEQVISTARKLYDDENLKSWAISLSLECQLKVLDVKNILQTHHAINYDSKDANKKIIKEGSLVEVLANHMDGMKGSAAIIKSYSLPANVSDITMHGGMKMEGHRWLTNDEVKLK